MKGLIRCHRMSDLDLNYLSMSHKNEARLFFGRGGLSMHVQLSNGTRDIMFGL